MIWVLGVLVILLWYGVVQYMLGKGSTPATLLRSQLCPSPDCLRCSAATKATYSTDVSAPLECIDYRLKVKASREGRGKITLSSSNMSVKELLKTSK